MLSCHASREPIGSSKGDVARLDTAGHIVRLGSRVDDLVDGLHGEVKGHEFALCHEVSKGVRCGLVKGWVGERGELTTG